MRRVSDYEELFKDKHAGEPGIIIANGPGLDNVPLEFLRKYPTLGCNRIHTMWEKEQFAPTYYAGIAFRHYETEDQREAMFPMMEQVEAAFINRMWVHKFPFDNVWGILSHRHYGAPDNKKREFSYDPLHTIGIGFTQTYINLQIAYYMGFDPVLIVGLDHTYDKKQPHFYKKKDAPHWPDPLEEGHYTNEQWIDGCDKVYAIARHCYSMTGREIINLSEPTECDIFKKGKINEWV